MYVYVSVHGFPFYQEPVSIPLGEQRVWKGRGLKRRCVVKKDSLVYIPLLNTLQSLLRNKAILAEVNFLFHRAVATGAATATLAAALFDPSLTML